MKTLKSVSAAASLGIAAAGALGLMAVTARAQSTDPVQKPLAIKLGIFVPTDNNDQKAAGSVQFSAGLQYDLTKTRADNPIVPSVYLDYFGGSRQTGHENTFGLGLQGRYYLSAPEAQSSSPYIGAGIGVYELDARRDNIDATSEHKTDIGGKLFVGDEFKGSYFVEANYEIMESAAGVNPSGVNVQIGYRF